MGPLFAVYRATAAFVSGIVGGILVGILDNGEDSESPDDRCRDAAISSCKVCNEPENPSFEHDHTLAAKTRAALRYGFIDFFSDIAGHILIGIVLAGVISYFLPDNFFSETIRTGFVSMLLMIVVGIPLYMCSTASVPVAYAMMLKGVTPGAALVFLVVGPATNVVTISVVGSVMETDARTVSCNHRRDWHCAGRAPGSDLRHYWRTDPGIGRIRIDTSGMDAYCSIDSFRAPDGNRVRTKVCGTPFRNRCGRCFRVRGVWLRVMRGYGQRKTEIIGFQVKI